MPRSREPISPKTSPKGKGGGKGLHKNIAGAPVWVWGAGILAAVLVGLYFRRRNASGTATAQPTADTSGTGAATDSGTADTLASGGLTYPDAKLTTAEAGLREAVMHSIDDLRNLTDEVSSGQVFDLGATDTPGAGTTTLGQDTAPSFAFTPDQIAEAWKAYNEAQKHHVNGVTQTAGGGGGFRVSKPGDKAGPWVVISASPNKAAGRSAKPAAVAQKPRQEVTHHATHTAPQPSRPKPQPKAKPTPKKKAAKKVARNPSIGQRKGGRPG